MSIDIWGRVWFISPSEACQVCGQPDNCGDCDHSKVPESQRSLINF